MIKISFSVLRRGSVKKSSVVKAGAPLLFVEKDTSLINSHRYFSIKGAILIYGDDVAKFNTFLFFLQCNEGVREARSVKENLGKLTISNTFFSRKYQHIHSDDIIDVSKDSIAYVVSDEDGEEKNWIKC